ncbi:hypothetical protein, partial [Streptococcus pneumoniae]
MYNDVIERISLYEFIGDIFYSKIISCCIVARDLSKNTMKLDVIFFEDKNKRSAVLGLRRDKSGVFKSVTPNHSYLSQLDVTYKTPDLMSHFLP